MNLLIRALRNEAPDWLVEHLKIHFPSDFEGARNKLLEFEQEQDEDGERKANRNKKKGRLLHMTNMLEAVYEKEMDDHNKEVEQLTALANRVGREFNRDNLWIAPEIFRAIKPETKEDILRVKKELLAKRYGELEKDLTPNKQPERSNRLPHQYGKVNNTKVHSEEDHYNPSDAYDTDPSDDEDIQAIGRALNTRAFNTRNLFMARTLEMSDDPTVRAHTEYYGTMKCNWASIDGGTMVIAYSGADTTILDDSWYIITPMEKCRRANLIGYDPGLGTKKDYQ